jgi:hypothetical protein
MPCVSEWPGGLCSGNGYCDAVTDSCVCNSGYGLPPRLLFFCLVFSSFNRLAVGLVTDARGDLIYRPGEDCALFRPALRGLHITNAVVAFLCLLWNLTRLGTRLQASSNRYSMRTFSGIRSALTSWPNRYALQFTHAIQQRQHSECGLLLCKS